MAVTSVAYLEGNYVLQVVTNSLVFVACAVLTIYIAWANVKTERENLLLLSFANMVASIVVTLWLFIFFVVPFSVKPGVCSMYHVISVYYITEAELFANRIGIFFRHQPKQRWLLFICRLGFAVTISVTPLVDAITRRMAGTFQWSSGPPILYCTNPYRVYGIVLPWLSLPLGAALWLYGCWVVYDFIHTTQARKSFKRETSKNSNFIILKIMLASYSSTIFVGLFVVLGLTLPLDDQGRNAIEWILVILAPIDQVLSLALSALVLHKVYRRKHSDSLNQGSNERGTKRNAAKCDHSFSTLAETQQRSGSCTLETKGDLSNRADSNRSPDELGISMDEAAVVIRSS